MRSDGKRKAYRQSCPLKSHCDLINENRLSRNCHKNMPLALSNVNTYPFHNTFRIGNNCFFIHPFHFRLNEKNLIVFKVNLMQVIRDIFNCPSLNLARECKRISVEKYAKAAPKFAEWLENNVEEGLTFFQFPQEHRKKIRTSNAMERLNQEIKRGTRVVRVFSNEESCKRLVTAILQEIHEEWITG